MWQETVQSPTSPEPAPRQVPGRPGPPPDLSATPFKFLDYFEESERDSFAGREDEVQEVLVGLTRGRTYVVYGRSGLGKTSLLLAGVFPRLRQRGFHPMRLRLLDSPVADFCTALATELERPELAREMGDAERLELVPRVLAERSANEPLVLVLDQFEEFFVRFKGRPDEQARFITLLGRIWRERACNVRLVFSIREDYIAQLSDLRSALPDLTDSGLRLKPLTPYGARQAIVRPLQHAGITYEEAFVSRLVDLLASWLFDPPALQIVCTELYRDVVARRGFPVHLTREDLERLGGVRGVFLGYVNSVARGLAAERLLLVRVVLDALIAPEARTRHALRVEDLLTVPVRAELEELREVLEHLTRLRLVRAEDRQGERWYELLHEQLVPIIEGWLVTDVDYVHFRQARKFVASLTQHEHWREDPGWLLSAAQLAEGVEPWSKRLRLDEPQSEFLLCSSIHARTGSIAYWARRFDEFGEGRSTGLLLKLSESPRYEVRLAAVAGCGEVRDESGRLASRCLELALSASEEELRRAAGGSFARLGRPRDIEALRQRLEQHGPSQPLLEVLADLWEAGHRLPGFPRRWRSHARHGVNERVVERHQRGIRHLVSIGVRAALTATAVWCLTNLVLQFVYRVVTLIPEWVSQRTVWSFTLVLVAVVLPIFLFLGLPVGGLVAWQVTRRACFDAVLYGRRQAVRAVLLSRSLMLACAVLSTLSWFVVMTVWESRGFVAIGSMPHLLLLLLGTSVLAWLMTAGIVWLGSRCIPPGRTRPSTVYLWALLSSAFPPIAVEQAMGGAVIRGWAGPYAQPLIHVMASASIVSSFLAMVLLSALIQSMERLPGPARVLRHQTLAAARALVAVTAVGCIVAFAAFIDVDTLPIHERRIQGELSWSGTVWNVEDADYLSLRAPHEGLFALSVQGEESPGTRLVIHGDELTRGSLLVSELPRITATVVPRAGPRAAEAGGAPAAYSDYEYVLREEPIHQERPGALSTEHWTLVTLPLRTLKGSNEQPSLWQTWLEGQLPPAQRKEITGVEVRPVMLRIAELPAQHCVAIMGSSGATYSTDIRTSITRNRPETAVVPPTDSRPEILLEDFRFELQDGGNWFLMMTVVPFQGFTPPQCKVPRGQLALLSGPGPALGEAGREPTLTLALKLY